MELELDETKIVRANQNLGYEKEIKTIMASSIISNNTISISSARSEIVNTSGFDPECN